MSNYSFIAAKLTTVLSEKVIPEKPVTVPFIILSKDTDPMTLGDYKWLNDSGLNKSFADEVRTGDAGMDAGIAVGQLFNHDRNGILVTDVEKLIKQGTMTDGTNTIAFAPTVAAALALFESKSDISVPEKVSVKSVKKRTRRTKAEMEAATKAAVDEVKVIDTSSLAMNTPAETEVPTVPEATEAVEPANTAEVTEETPTEEVVEETTDNVEISAPATEEVSEESVEEKTAVDEAEPTEDPVQDIFNAVNEDILSGFAEVAATGTEEKPEKMVFPDVPTGDPNYEKLKRNLIQSGVTNADIPYILTALQISEGKDNLRASLMKTIGIEDEVDSILTKMQADRYYKGYKDLAMEIVPYEAYI